jgi:hypothetical protein
MTKVPEQDEEEDTPFGIAKLKAGIQKWRTVFRVKTPWSDYPTGKLGDMDSIGAYFKLRVKGFDEVFARQVQYVCWKHLPDIPIIRAEVVPEMGNKARIVTCGDYHLGPLQSPISHLLKWYLGFHPSAHSSLKRCDQAWRAVVSFQGTENDKSHYTLSSDLEEATNALVQRLCKAQVLGFARGININVRTPYFKLFLETIGPRIVHIRSRDEYIYSTRGIFMGEAIAKPLLTLTNLAAEELAMIRYKGLSIEGLGCNPIFKEKWRNLHIAGDDLLAHGPRKYLDLITKIQKSWGCKISKDKHALSKSLVRYTETVLYLPNMSNKFNQSDKRIEYFIEESMWTDGTKVRLLEQGQSTQLKKDEKNVAFGKALQLSNNLRYQPKIFRQTVINLFCKRMGNLLPNPKKHPKIWYQIQLPAALGGLNLGVGEDIYEMVNNSPYPTKRVLAKAKTGADCREEYRILGSLKGNPSIRGSVPYKEAALRTVQALEDGNFPRGRENFLTSKEVSERYGGVYGRDLVDLARADSIYTYEEYALMANRGLLFTDLIIRNPGRKDVFGTVPYDVRYKNIWTQLMELTQGFEPPEEGFTKENTPGLRWLVLGLNLGGFIEIPKPIKSPFGNTLGSLAEWNYGFTVPHPTFL